MSRILPIVAVVSLCSVLLLAGCYEGVDSDKGAGGQGGKPSKPAAESPNPPPSRGATSDSPSKSTAPAGSATGSKSHNTI